MREDVSRDGATQQRAGKAQLPPTNRQEKEVGSAPCLSSEGHNLGLALDLALVQNLPFTSQPLRLQCFVIEALADKNSDLGHSLLCEDIITYLQCP